MLQHHRSRRAAPVAVGGFAPRGRAVRAPLTTADRRRIRALIGRMSLAEKVGQLFVMRVHGSRATSPDPVDVAANRTDIGVADADELIATYHLGGVVYFAWAHNTRDPHQIAELSNGIQRAGLRQDTPVPLLVSIDQEHGAVARIGPPATLYGGAMALGASGNVADARTAARIAGAELAALGVNHTYSPLCDVNIDPANPIIGVRSFGADPRAAAALVAAQVRGYRDAGVASTAKHFPGHGDTTQDSHVALPVVDHSLERWRSVDAPPFRAAIGAGVDAVMTAHILVPALDGSGDPATLSRPIVTGILREQLGYDGLVVTDALGMAGVRAKYGDDRVPVLALLAGADQLLDPPRLDVAYHAVLDAVRSGEVPLDRIEASVARVLALKSRLGLFRRPFVTHQGVDRVVGARAHRLTAGRITERGVTLLAAEPGALPLRRGTAARVLVTGVDPKQPTGTGLPPTTALARELARLGYAARALATGTTPDAATVQRAVDATADRDAVVVCTYDVTPAAPEQIALVTALAATGVPVVTLALRNPYDAAWLPPVAASLACYGWAEVSVRAAARVIAGAVRPTGRLPVAVPRADDPSQTLYPIGHGLSY